MRYPVLSLLCLLSSTTVAAQSHNAKTELTSEEPQNDQAQPVRSAAPRNAAGQTMNVGNGTIGQRQTRIQAGSGVRPLNRIENRIASRVQNRLRTRIDRYYDPQANALAPFSVASDQMKDTARAQAR